MKIVIDARFWSESGIGRYLRNLIRDLQKIDKTNEYLILHLKKDSNTLVYQNLNFQKVLADVKWYGIAEQLKILRILRKLQPDLVHFPHFNVPIFYDGRYVVTIHDLIHQHFATRSVTTHNPLIHKIKNIGYRKAFQIALTKSAKIITPSNFVKDQLIDEWRVNRDKVKVTYEAADNDLVNITKQVKNKDFERLAKRFNLEKPYLFYVGNAQPHKNIPRLIQAFREIKKNYPKLLLILSGPDHYFWQEVKKEVEKLPTKGVIFTGFVTDRELVTLYKNAQAFVMPSLEEGFGIPLLEAMACGCPVVSSNAGSLSEVGGDAAIYFNPQNVGEMAKKVSQAVDNENLRKKLIEKGLKRVKEFSWLKMAEQTLDIYQQAR